MWNVAAVPGVLLGRHKLSVVTVDDHKDSQNIFKVHLTPKFFFAKKKSSCFGDHVFEKVFLIWSNPRFFMTR